MILKQFSHQLLDLLLPPRCLHCGDAVSNHQSLCGSCWSRLTFLRPPYCKICGWPFPHEDFHDLLCPNCSFKKPVFASARAVVHYNDGSKGLILKFKHGDATYLAPALSQWMVQAAPEILAKTDCLIPVPLHWRRLLMRRYNQATLLAQGISKKTGIALGLGILKRHRATSPQGHFSRKARSANVQRAFNIPEEKADKVRNKAVTLIDDVQTTGATLTECAKVLLKHGAKEVNILTLARVIRPE